MVNWRDINDPLGGGAELHLHSILKEAAARGWDLLVELVQRDQAPQGLQERLRQALEGYRHQKADQILNTLPDGIAVTDAQGVITFANKALGGLLGLRLAQEELRGKRIQQCLEKTTEQRPAAEQQPFSIQPGFHPLLPEPASVGPATGK